MMLTTLLIASLSAGLASATTALLARRRTSRQAQTHTAKAAQDAQEVAPHQAKLAALTTRALLAEREAARLRAWLGLPEAGPATWPQTPGVPGASQDTLREAMCGLEALKHGVVSALLDESGWVVCGDERDERVHTLSALAGCWVASGRVSWGLIWRCAARAVST